MVAMRWPCRVKLADIQELIHLLFAMIDRNLMQKRGVKLSLHIGVTPTIFVTNIDATPYSWVSGFLFRKQTRKSLGYDGMQIPED